MDGGWIKKNFINNMRKNRIQCNNPLAIAHIPFFGIAGKSSFDFFVVSPFALSSASTLSSRMAKSYGSSLAVRLLTKSSIEWNTDTR
jgi:hypothetical protein